MSTEKSKFDYKEVYSQRYQTYRHLDRLRWLMMQIGITAASLVFTIPTESSIIFYTNSLSAGFILMFTSLAMFKINDGIKNNSIMLKIAGEHIGDDLIPESSKDSHSISSWMALSIFLAGMGLVITHFYYIEL